MMAVARLRGEAPVRYGISSLAPRERQVLRLYVDHGRNKLVAHAMGVSEQTVKNHVTSILRKLDVASMGQAAVLFDRAERDRGRAWPEVERRSGWERRHGDRRQLDRRREQQ